MSRGTTFSNDQVVFATAGYDHTIRLWKPHTGHCLKVLHHNEGQVNCMAIYPDKTLLATGGYQHVSIYSINSNQQQAILNLEGTTKNTVAIGFQEKGAWMYTAGEDKTLKIWDMKSKHVNCLKQFNHTSPITCVSLHPNQFDFLIGDEAGNLVRYDIRGQNETLFSEPKCAMRSIAINQEGTMMAAVNNDGDCFVWNMNGGFGDSPLRVFARDTVYHPHKRYALKCLFSPDLTLLATSSADGTAKIWKTIDFSLVSEFKDAQQRWVWDMAFTLDSEYLFTASSDKIARMWSVKSGEIEKEYVGHQKPLVCLAFSDSKFMK